ncbi:MAG: cyclic-di-AMP receptor [Clostridia bacterium]|nr:cyclic-di-AMP receptor [Clostridia bacterium]
MKMITAIVNRRDTSRVCEALTNGGVEFTRLATTGGFLRAGNTTLMIGVEDERLEHTLELIRKNCARRMEKVPTPPAAEMPVTLHNPHVAEVLVGGAIVFVNDVSYFEKM